MSLSLSPPPSGSAEPANTPGLLGTAPSSPNSSTGSFASAMSSQTQIPNVVASDGSPVVDSASPAGASEAVSASTAVNANLTSSPVEYTRFFMPEDMIVFQVSACTIFACRESCFDTIALVRLQTHCTEFRPSPLVATPNTLRPFSRVTRDLPE